MAAPGGDQGGEFRAGTGPSRRISRRAVLAAAGGAGIGGAVAATTAVALTAGSPGGADQTVAFWGANQAGIDTPVQQHLLFAAFDVVTTARVELTGVLEEWTAAAARMTAGQTAQPLTGNPYVATADTGEAVDLPPSRLTLTLGFGSGLFTTAGFDRFGLAARRPPALVDLPAFPGDQLDPSRCGGDLAVQACADDPQVAFHAIRELALIGQGAVTLRWIQAGFLPTPSTTPDTSPRNLLGFQDGTNNIRPGDASDMGRFVWAGNEGPAWMTGGTYLVARRIRVTVEKWDRTALGVQEETVGRHKASGAPLGQARASDPVDLGVVVDGRPVIPADAHIRLAGPAANGGQRILRRGYSFSDGLDGHGLLDAGLFFVAFQCDPRKQFIPIFNRLAASDALAQYVVHTGSAVFACPGGAGAGGWVGRPLFA